MFLMEDDGIYLTRGDTCRFAIQVEYFDGTDYTLKPGDDLVFTLKKKTTDLAPIFQKHGSIVNINPSDTATLEYGKYWFDVQLTMANGEVQTIVGPLLFRITDEVS